MSCVVTASRRRRRCRQENAGAVPARDAVQVACARVRVIGDR